jgi:hypothetical protein
VPDDGTSENGDPAPRKVSGPDVDDQFAGEPPVFDSVTEAVVAEVPKSIDDDDRLSAAGGGGGGGGSGGVVVVVLVVVAGGGGATVVVATGGGGAGTVVVAATGAAADSVVWVTTPVGVVDVVEVGELVVVDDVGLVELVGPDAVVVVAVGEGGDDGEIGVGFVAEFGASVDDADAPDATPSGAPLAAS